VKSVWVRRSKAEASVNGLLYSDGWTASKHQVFT
jgi:hypothetical protein